MQNAPLRLSCVLALLALTFSGFAANYDPPIVEVDAGQLRGFMDGDIYNFRGVPYATAERWQQPQPYPAWEGVRDAQAYGPISPISPPSQVSGGEFVFPHRYWVQNEEECMNLNVWTPTLDPEATKPVMVFFHGGMYSNGSSIEGYAYEGKNLSEFGDVVVVTVNHRLNVLGALDLSAYGEEYANSRNIVIADLVAALQWIQDNIEVFGGDPDRVMIFGQSGGSGKTTSLLHCPATEGLYHRAVTMSDGTPEWMTPGDSARVAEVILEKFDLDGTQIDELKAIPYIDLIRVANEALSEVARELGRGFMTWAPTPDGTFILEMDTWAEHTKDMPIMIGSVFSEIVGTMGEEGKNEWTDEEVEAKLLEKYGDDKDAVVAEFSRLHPNKPVQDVLYYANRARPLRNLTSRYNFVPDSTPVYNYLFSYEYPVNGGVTSFHCSEIAFVFHNVGNPELRLATGGAPEAFALQDKVSQAWINFATTGNPSFDGVQFQPWTPETPNAVVFDITTEATVLDDVVLCDTAQCGGFH